ncbi:MAG: type I-E CRISPR-associated protein Cas5/CasD [Thermodesulfobacteriota bacterium]
MSAAVNTLFLRLEGPLQAWGDTSKFVIRRTLEAPTKSGVIGLLCCAMGLSRQKAHNWLRVLCDLKMGVRLDRPGEPYSDYHTLGAKVGVLRADGVRDPKTGLAIKRTASTGEIETLITRREYLCDASFLVALQGEPGLIEELKKAVENPRWTLYLGRKCCPPSRPLLLCKEVDGVEPTGNFPDLLTALEKVPWPYRFEKDKPKKDQSLTLDCLLDLEPTPEKPEAPDNALVWYDVPRSFDPPAHDPRFVIPKTLTVGVDGVRLAEKPAQKPTPPPPRLRTDYGKSTWGKIRDRRLAEDRHLCVFCKSPATTGQHVSYRRAGKEDNLAALANENKMKEHLDDLRSLCRLCHDAVTMLEYGLGMGLDRINPEEPRWREKIIRKRDEIVKFRSLETRRRRLAAEEVE